MWTVVRRGRSWCGNVGQLLLRGGGLTPMQVRASLTMVVESHWISSSAVSAGAVNKQARSHRSVYASLLLAICQFRLLILPGGGEAEGGRVGLPRPGPLWSIVMTRGLCCVQKSVGERISRVATLLISTEARAWSMYEVAFAARPLLSDGEKKVLSFVWGNCSRPRSMRERE